MIPLAERPKACNQLGKNSTEFYFGRQETYADSSIINLMHGDPSIPPHSSVRDELNRIAASSLFADQLEPDWELPETARDEGTIFLHHYRWPRMFTPELATASLADFQRSGIPVSTEDQLVVGCGVTQLFNAAMYTLVPAGGKMLMPIPTYGIFVAQANRMEVTLQPIETIETTSGNKIIPESLDGLLDDNGIAALMFINPDNPTGALYTKEELETLARVLLAHKLIPVIVDEIYNRLILEPSYPFTSFASLKVDGQDMFHRTITLRGPSKSYGLAKCRMGYGCGPEDVIAQLKKYVFSNVYIPSDVDQLLTAAALNHTPEEYFECTAQSYRRKRDYVSGRITAINDRLNTFFQTDEMISVSHPITGQFQILSLPAFLGSTTPDGTTLKNDLDLVDYLIKHGVSFIPGSAIGYPGEAMKLRLTFTSADEDLTEGLNRLENALSSLITSRQ